MHAGDRLADVVDPHPGPHGRGRRTSCGSSRRSSRSSLGVLVLFGVALAAVRQRARGRGVPVVAGHRRGVGRRSPRPWRTTMHGRRDAATPAFALMAAFERGAARPRRARPFARGRRRAAARRVGRVPAACDRTRRRRCRRRGRDRVRRQPDRAQRDLAAASSARSCASRSRRSCSARSSVPPTRDAPTRPAASHDRVHASRCSARSPASVWPPAILLAPLIGVAFGLAFAVRRRRAAARARARRRGRSRPS